MPEYAFKAVDVQGKFVNGVSSAPDRESLSRILHDQGLFLMEAAEAGAEAAAARKSGGFMELLSRLDGLWARPKIKLKDVSFVTSQMSIMVRSALPILETLDILSSQAANPAMKAVLKAVAQDVSHGTPLSEAFGRHPAVFDQVFVSLLAAGESSGKLDVMLERIAQYLDSGVKMSAKIRGALIYPVIVISMATAIVGFLITFVLPTFAGVFAQLNVDLPWPTRALISTGAFLRSWWWALLLVAGAAAWAARRWVKDPRNALAVDRLMLSLPLFGELTRNVALTRVLRTLGSLLESGVSILQSLELSKTSAGNRVFQNLLERVARDVKEGRVLSASLAQSPEIPKAVIGMIATGEKTGTLPEVIGRVATFYESETDNAVKNIFAAMEPLFMVGLAVMVGGIAVTVLLPMFDMAGGLK